MAKRTNILSYNEARQSANSRRAFARYADSRFTGAPLGYPQRSSRMVKGSSADGRRTAYDALDFYADYDNRASQLLASKKRPAGTRPSAPRSFETDYSRMMDFRPAPARNLNLADARQTSARRDAFGGLTKSQVIQARQQRVPQARQQRAPQTFANETSIDFASISLHDQERQASLPADEVVSEQLVAKDTLADRLKRKNEDARKARNKKKAEQALERHAAEQSARTVSPDAEGPRAAVYEARMGASHKRAARMQDNAAKGLPSIPFKLPAVSVDGLVTTLKRPPVFASLAVACCLALSLGFMYPVTRDYYQAVREQDRAAIELEMVLDRNQTLQSEVNALQTSEGIKTQARDQLGWIEMGEQIATVEGMDANQSSASIKPRIMSENVKAPDTWYSGLLDPLFGVK